MLQKILLNPLDCDVMSSDIFETRTTARQNMQHTCTLETDDQR